MAMIYERANRLLSFRQKKKKIDIGGLGEKGEKEREEGVDSEMDGNPWIEEEQLLAQNLTDSFLMA
eukprot:CAMPEP_0201492728 /NCGR_PEP_ID=MMETSP0151_2-20130828/34505_1 /ASSEMBLY_ACC=CAM_ASM_000257 /TAXON_ID=200890 /ORGANISM="Paramoeba atlantica, Strain 621/1 / CCAP 1560/9" /LENGTH=65 /DNA_ID=CAMNT_0047879711 /DNA_START=73 /DNA_END=267 /DNA_ORIENTATION=-